MKITPLLSIWLIFIANLNLGWVLSQSKSPEWVWLGFTFFVLIMAESLASPWALIRNVFFHWMESDVRAFLTVIFTSFVAVIMLSWLHISAHLLILVISASIARLDLQTANVSELNAFLILASLSLLGLGGGWLMYQWHFLVFSH